MTVLLESVPWMRMRTRVSARPTRYAGSRPAQTVGASTAPAGWSNAFTCAGHPPGVLSDPGLVAVGAVEISSPPGEVPRHNRAPRVP